VLDTKSTSLSDDENLTFQRLRNKMNKDNFNETNRAQVWTTSSPLDFSNVTDTTLVTIGDNHKTSIKEEDERGVKPSRRSLIYSKSFNSSVQSNQQNGSTLKLIHAKEDADSKEVRTQQLVKSLALNKDSGKM
jgi:hypothetical protein